MNNSKPVLSICIPTYNRQKSLKKCLDCIIDQDLFNTDEIEIVISDNASSDNTTQLVKSYQEKYKNIKYFRNNENLGCDRNIINVIKSSDGIYTWLFGDDDIILEGGLNSVLNTIYNNKGIGIILLNYLNNNSPIIRCVKNDSFFINGQDYINKIVRLKPSITEMDAFKMTFLSSLVINKEMWDSVDNSDKYIGTGLLHTYTILDFIQKSSVFFVIEPIVKQNNIPFRGDIYISNEYTLAYKWCKLYLLFIKIFKVHVLYFLRLAVFFFLMYIYKIIRNKFAKLIHRSIIPLNK